MIYYAQWPIARKQIMCPGPLQEMTLKVADLDEFKTIFEPALGDESEGSIYEKKTEVENLVRLSLSNLMAKILYCTMFSD
jgi:hypothetical protein